jgi:oligopeptide/dipeptide ABC transporter ATP-binding protein
VTAQDTHPSGQPHRDREERAPLTDKVVAALGMLAAASALLLPWAGAVGRDNRPVSLSESYGGPALPVAAAGGLAMVALLVPPVRRLIARPIRRGAALVVGLAMLGVLVVHHWEVNGPRLRGEEEISLAPGLAFLVVCLCGLLLVAFGLAGVLGEVDRQLRGRKRARLLAVETDRDLEYDRPLLSIRGLQTYFRVMDGTVKAVDGVDLEIPRGGTVGLVGESGCGKSVTALSIMRLIDTPPGEFAGGEIWFDGRDLLTLDGDEIRSVRGKDIAMIFQEPMTSLNPVFTVGDQIMEAVLYHNDVSRDEALERTIEALRLVGVSAPERRVKQYPHEMSGGMRQRAMIAMALSCQPKLLIADEPTTALDVTIQAQILELIKDLQARTGTALLLITHDLAVVAETVHQVAVMYAGRVVEAGPVEAVLLSPRHPYTQGLLNSIPALHKRGQELDVIKGVVPNPFRMPPGCKFEPRCPYAWERCRASEPELMPVPGTGAQTRCFLYTSEGASRRTAFEKTAAASTRSRVAKQA